MSTKIGRRNVSDSNKCRELSIDGLVCRQKQGSFTLKTREGEIITCQQGPQGLGGQRLCRVGQNGRLKEALEIR